jgi:tyrosyl-tRNA synthetase
MLPAAWTQGAAVCYCVQVDSEGRKFGKSTGGAIWLSAEKLSPYKFYQYLFQVCSWTGFGCLCPRYFHYQASTQGKLVSSLVHSRTHDNLLHTDQDAPVLQVTDADVIIFLRMLTFLPLEEIDAMEQAMARPDYAPNTAQKRLAEAVTRWVAVSSEHTT